MKNDIRIYYVNVKNLFKNQNIYKKLNMKI